MRVIFVNRFFFPDHSATSQMLSDLAFALAKEGRDVHIVTSRLRYDDPSDRLAAEEVIDGVQVHRVWTSRFGRTSLAGRLTDYVSFYAAAFIRLLVVCRRGDLVVAKTDPPLISLVAYVAARLRAASLVNWVQDLYPETAQALGVPLLSGPLGSALRALRNRTLAGAVANVAVGRHMALKLARGAGTSGTTHVVPNWANAAAIHPVSPPQNELRRTWGLEGRFVVAYSGNLGAAHEYQTLLEAAGLLAGDPDLRFLFIGGGRGTAGLRKEVQAKGLDRLFCFQPYQPSEALAKSLSAGDVHWISLRPEFEGLIVPSKVYGIMAAGRPVLAVCDPDGEPGVLVRDHGCGLVVAPGEGRALADAIVRLKNDDVLRSAMGSRCRALVETTLSREASITSWSQLLGSLRPAS